MKNILLCTAILLASGFTAPTAPKPVKSCVVAGVKWVETLEAAKSRAKEANKPILLLQMFGSLDEEFC